MKNRCLPTRTSLFTILLTFAAQLLPLGRARSAEDHVDTKFEYYIEDANRIKIVTQGVLFEKSLTANLSLKGEYVYDGISGATPTGAPPPVGANQVPTTNMEDVRHAGALELAAKLGPHTLTPQISYSTEGDYDSLGIALNDAIEFNEKNTTLLLGVAHSFDTIQPEFWTRAKHKDSTDVMVGVTQLLNPRTVLQANLTLGYSWGYLADPYKSFRFDGYPDPTGVFPEKRPGHRTKEVLFLSLTHFFEKPNASLEVSYRFYHDSFDILSHTVALAWHQKIGNHLILSPLFRYYDQTAADFYAVRLPGDPSDPDSTVPIPDAYSADYRLSSMHTLTYGVEAAILIKEWLHVNAAYKRYAMFGDDDTPTSAYPNAHVFTIGARLWF